MSFRIPFAAAMLAFAAPALAQSTTPAKPQHEHYRHFQEYDLNHDGKLSLDEIKNAAAVRFDQLDADHNGTLTREEAKHRISAAEFKASDPDHDGTLDKAEYLKLVEARFNAANPDKDGTIEPEELATPVGRKLRQLLP